MNVVTKVFAAIAIPTLFSISLPSSAGLIFGSSAQTQFQNFQSTLVDTHIDFNSFAAQSDLTTQISGLTFRTTRDRAFTGDTAVNLEVNVICSPGNPFGTSCSDSNRMISGVRLGGITDGQALWEI